MTQLLCCPFCGGEAEYLPDRLMAPGAPPPVFCNGCHASALDAEAWNRRTPPADVAALVEALERIAGGDHPEGTSLAVNNNYRELESRLRAIARAALARGFSV